MFAMTTFKSPIGRIAVLATATIMAFSLAACGGNENDDKVSATVTASSTVEAKIEESPLLIGMPLHLADEKATTIDATDLGPEIVDGEEYQRGIIDRSNWRIVAQCDQMKNGRVKVGAVKSEEHWIIVNGGQGSTIANNELQGLLECP